MGDHGESPVGYGGSGRDSCQCSGGNHPDGPLDNRSLDGPLACVGLTDGRAIIAISSPNTSVYFLFRASDNVGLAELKVLVAPIGLPSSFSVTPYLQAGNASDCVGQVGPYPGGTYNVTFRAPLASSSLITISARDAKGLETILGFEIQVM